MPIREKSNEALEGSRTGTKTGCQRDGSMKDFAALFMALDGTTKTNAKVAALAQYFGTASEADRLWTIALLSGRRPKRAVNATRLSEWAAEVAGLPLWLFEESYAVVGDLAETIALVLPEAQGGAELSLADWISEIRGLQALDEPQRRAFIIGAWNRLETTERFVFNKLLTGGFRMGVSRKLMTRGLAEATGIDEAELQHRLMGDWSPENTTYERLVLAPEPGADLSRPYPFQLAYQLDADPNSLGSPTDWAAEWKWDGIRGQLIVRGGTHHLWSRGEELMTDRFPEFLRARDYLPDGTVLDGEVLAMRAGDVLPFNVLQKRIGRKKVPKKLLEDAPAGMLAYDILEADGEDLRDKPYRERRARLETLLDGLPREAPVRLSEVVPFDTWTSLAGARETSRDHLAEGLMLKRLDSPYVGGRKKGDWWKWKVDPLSIDAVMIYAQAGHGRRANLFTDFTFAVRSDDGFTPFAKAYSGLTDAEFREITAWVRKNTLERYGPVRAVPPEHVFEIHFEGIQASPRHKSGVALRFPRMARWRKDKPVSEIDTLDHLKEMLDAYG